MPSSPLHPPLLPHRDSIPGDTTGQCYNTFTPTIIQVFMTIKNMYLERFLHIGLQLYILSLSRSKHYHNCDKDIVEFYLPVTLLLSSQYLLRWIISIFPVLEAPPRPQPSSLKSSAIFANRQWHNAVARARP